MRCHFLFAANKIYTSSWALGIRNVFHWLDHFSYFLLSIISKSGRLVYVFACILNIHFTKMKGKRLFKLDFHDGL